MAVGLYLPVDLFEMLHDKLQIGGYRNRNRLIVGTADLQKQ